MKGPHRKPTDAELGILTVLWSRGPSTVRQIAEKMGREAGYTTILKLLQIMTEKGLVERDETVRPQIYRPQYSQERTQRQLLRDVWGPSHIEQSHYLRIYMGQLRHKLEDDPARPSYLLTETGVGYRLASE